MIPVATLLVGQATDIGKVSRLFELHLVLLSCVVALAGQQALRALGYLIVA